MSGMSADSNGMTPRDGLVHHMSELDEGRDETRGEGRER